MTMDRPEDNEVAETPEEAERRKDSAIGNALRELLEVPSPTSEHVAMAPRRFRPSDYQRNLNRIREEIHQTELETTITQQRRELAELQRSLLEKQQTSAEPGTQTEEHTQHREELRAASEALTARQQLLFLLNRVHESARPVLEKSLPLQNRFFGQERCTAFVIVMDLRRSTDLMLKARPPASFAKFIKTLSEELRRILIQEHGIFDKFTGDGVLAFFPEFYSGEDAGYYALSAAERCHEFFADHYRSHRTSFTGVPLDVGLGIGMDYGSTYFVPYGGEFSIVGEPVVYASRMAEGPAGTTLLNQRAYEEIHRRFGSCFAFDEVPIGFKREGDYLAYSVSRTERPHRPAAPTWLSYAE